MGSGISSVTPGIFGLLQQGNEEIYQTFGYDGDGNRLFSTVKITRYRQIFKQEPGQGEGEGTLLQNNTNNKAKEKKSGSIPKMKVMAKGGNGNGNGNGKDKEKDNNGKGNDQEKDNGKGFKYAFGKDKEKTNNGKHLGWYKRTDHPKYPGTLPPSEIIEEEYQAVNYVNDISREYTEVLMVSNEDGDYTATYLYGLEKIMAENVPVVIPPDEEQTEIPEEQTEVPIQPERYDPLYYLYDGLGSVAQLVNDQGEVWNKYMYDPYGEPKAAGKLLLNRHKEELLYTPYGFTGKSHDFYNGLIYLRARYYDPVVGSFISRDSYLGELMRPLSQNRYTYSENNPVNYVDPSGHETAWIANDWYSPNTPSNNISGNSEGNDKDRCPGQETGNSNKSVNSNQFSWSELKDKAL